MRDVIIRNAKIKDKYQAAELWDEFIEYHKKLTKREFKMVDNAPKVWMEFFEKHVRARTRKAIVAEYNGKIIGYLLGFIEKNPPILNDSHHAFICDLAVTEIWRNKGIGTELMDEFVKWVKEKGMKEVLLYVVPENKNAIKLYENFNYKTIFQSMRKMI